MSRPSRASSARRLSARSASGGSAPYDDEDLARGAELEASFAVEAHRVQFDDRQASQANLLDGQRHGHRPWRPQRILVQFRIRKRQRRRLEGLGEFLATLTVWMRPAGRALHRSGRRSSSGFDIVTCAMSMDARPQPLDGRDEDWGLRQAKVLIADDADLGRPLHQWHRDLDGLAGEGGPALLAVARSAVERNDRTKRRPRDVNVPRIELDRDAELALGGVRIVTAIAAHEASSDVHGLVLNPRGQGAAGRAWTP